jgi:predicted short-subunit dehydrogenase-like oxidoreductase (DUF2520 family)
MDIVIIGTGNTATVLGKKMKAAGHQISQVFGRDPHRASELAYALDTESANYSSIIYKKADLYLVTVSDRSIEEVLNDLQLGDRPIAHTAGSVSLEVLRPYTSAYGVFYPLQSLKKEVGELPDIPILIDANNPSTRYLLSALAHSISPLVIEAGDELRFKVHMAAVFCNNFVNHIYFLMERYCAEQGIDFRLLIPLIQETGRRLNHTTPAHTQTGPASRKDTATLEKHLLLLENQPELKELYQLFTQSIQRYH